MSPQKRRKNQKGFTLIELLVTVGIILVILAIAVPSYLAAKRSSNQSAAAGSVDGFAKSASMYSNEWQVAPLTVANLGGAELGPGTAASCAKGGEITTADATTLSGTMTRAGYLIDFASTGTATGLGGCSGATSFEITARPVTLGVTGNNAYCADQTGHYYVVGVGVKSTGISCATDGYATSLGQ